MKVVIVGLGSIGRKHVAALRKMDASCQIFALRSAPVSQKMEGVENIYRYEDILSIQPDFIIISNPTALHYDALSKVVKYDIPLFIEKPIFDYLDSKKNELMLEIENRKIITYVACNLRFLHALKKIKEEVVNERVNEVNSYCGSYLPDWRPGVDFRTIYSANQEQGGGVHIDLIHELDYMYWIFGMPKETQSTFRNVSSLYINAFDYANYIWEYNTFTANIILNYYRRDAKRMLEVVCESGTYLVDLLKNIVYYNGEVFFSSAQTIADTYYDQLSYFINNVLVKDNHFNSITQAAEVLSLCLQD